MKQKRADKSSRVDEPVWCEYCRLRIAPYEETAIAGTKSFHAHCYRKEETKKDGHDPLEKSGLNLAVA